MAFKLLRDQHGIAAAEGERVGHHSIQLDVVSPHIRHVIEIAFRVGLVQADGGWNGLVLQRQYRSHESHRTGHAHQVAAHGLQA